MQAADVPRIAEIFRDAFNELYERRGFGPVVPDASVGAAIAQAYARLDPNGCVVVTTDGRIAGSGFLHARGTTAGTGPITVDPAMQGAGAGRLLMREICRRADLTGVTSLRLIQDAFNESSFALYSRVGFVAREALVRASFARRPHLARADGIRAAMQEDIAAIVSLEQRLLGIARPQDFEMLLRMGEVLVADDGATGAIAGSIARVARNGVAVLGPALSTSLEALIGLIAGAVADLPARTDIRLLIPARFPDLLERLYQVGLEVHSLCTYMARGEFTGFGGYYVPTLFPESG